MKVVIVGLGNQGSKRAAVAGHNVVATVDPAAPAAAFKDIGDVPVESYDAALVCVPDSAKFGLIHALLSAGKHVLVEKPLLSEHAGDLSHLCALAADRRVTLYTAYNHRFEPHIVTLRDMLADGEIGTVYSARIFYGNGTARDVRESSWRDTGSGVLADLGSHLIDISLFLFGSNSADYEPQTIDRFENKAPDRAMFTSNGPVSIQFEATLLSWRNTFCLDVYGSEGSAHIDCLCKWGPSTLTIRKRVLPSGKPRERSWVLEQPDPTWDMEYGHFIRLCESGGTNIANDHLIDAAIKSIERKWEVKTRS